MSYLCNYSVSKQLKIPSDFLWCILITLFLIVFLTIVLYTFLTTNDNQNYENGLSAVTIDIDGSTMDDSNKEVWDASDVLVPVEEGAAFFVTTNFQTTKYQQRGTCAENEKVAGAHCDADEDCTEGKTFPGGHGVATGTCSLATSTCNIEAWCPVQGTDEAAPTTEKTFLTGTKNFVLSITNQLYFPAMNRAFNNLKSSKKGCRHSKTSEEDQQCANFVLGDVVGWALENSGQGGLSYGDLVHRGAVISIKILWECYNVKECKPKYQFERLDRNIGVIGYDLEYNHKYSDGSGKRSRDHIHSYGILFKIQVDADGYNYSPTKTLRILITTFISAVGVKALLDGFVSFCNPEVKGMAEVLKYGCHCKSEEDSDNPT